jgi:hypothetical protein
LNNEAADIKVADIGDDRKGPLFRAAIGKTKRLTTTSPMTRQDVCCMVHCRTADAGIETAIGLPHLSRDRDYGVFKKRRNAGKGGIDGPSRRYSYHPALRRLRG